MLRAFDLLIFGTCWPNTGTLLDKKIRNVVDVINNKIANENFFILIRGSQKMESNRKDIPETRARDKQD